MIKATTTKPPITPPTIAPVLLEDFEVLTAALVFELEGAEEEEEDEGLLVLVGAMVDPMLDGKVDAG